MSMRCQNIVRRAAVAGVLGALASMAMLSACASDPRAGYAPTSTFDSTVSSVSVPMFRNTTATPGIEQTLTDAVIKQIQANTPMRVVQSGQAASTLSAVITEVRMRRISANNVTGLVQELAVQITVDFEWRDNRSGEVLKARRNFSAADSFVPSRPSGERLELGENAAAQRLARDMVNELRGAW
ncbi:hypothetical protein LBMAG48_30160 [Phycisphaerae bacterium]|nr:hypothetical protein LBMAG48_30160 [Phycisphaerae bacterium]